MCSFFASQKAVIKSMALSDRLRHLGIEEIEGLVPGGVDCDRH